MKAKSKSSRRIALGRKWATKERGAGARVRAGRSGAQGQGASIQLCSSPERSPLQPPGVSEGGRSDFL